MIYYSHVNEDNLVERQLLSRESFRELWCVAGSGERVISLLDADGLERVHVVDINPEAIYLLQLKLAALEQLPVLDYLAFIGAYEREGSERQRLFAAIKEQLPAACRNYWERRDSTIRNGILYSGHFEQFLGRLRPLLRLFLGRGFFDCLHLPLEQCYQFPYRRWNILKALFRRRWAYRLSGNRDIAFTAGDARQAVIPEALQQLLDRDLARGSFMFHLIFAGHLRDMNTADLPLSLQEAFLHQVQERLRKKDLDIHYHCSDLLELWQETNSRRDDQLFFSLSDLLSFEDFNYLQAFCRDVREKHAEGAVLVLRTFLRHELTGIQAAWLSDYFSGYQDLTSAERTAMYRVFAFDNRSGETVGD